jgi:hypothetical protein
MQHTCHVSTFFNPVLQKYFDYTYVAYLDIIPIFSENEKEHRQHIHVISYKLWEGSCAAKREKCQFHQTSLNFLGYIVSKYGIHTNTTKLEAVQERDRTKT